MDPRSREFFEDWEAAANDTVRILRSEAARDPSDAGPAELVEELLDTSTAFRDSWSRHDVRLPAAGRHVFSHPTAGRLELEFEAAELRADAGLTMLLAAGMPGSVTEAALHALASESVRSG